MEGAVKTTLPTILIGFGISFAPSIRPGGHQASCQIWLRSQCSDCRMTRLLITDPGVGQNIHTNQQSCQSLYAKTLHLCSFMDCQFRHIVP